MHKRLLCKLTAAMICSGPLLSPLALGGEGKPKASVASKATTGKSSSNKSKEILREEFFEFVGSLFEWTAYFIKLRKDDNEPITELYWRLPEEKKSRFRQMFEEYRDVMVALDRYADLNVVHNIPVIPQSVYEHIRQRFAIKDRGAMLKREELIIKLIGGDFNFGVDESGKAKKLSISGFIKCIAELDMNKWAPVKEFINNFENTLAMDSRLSQSVGKSLLPLVKHYYSYMDPVSRLRMLKELADDMKHNPFTGRSYNDHLDSVTVKVFQNSGPVMIKFLQQLQEEVSGNSPMTKVLAELKHSKPMNIKKAEKLAKEELRRLTGDRHLEDFEFIRKPLGIASIAQTHKFMYKGRPYVVKLQKDKVDEVYAREKEFLNRLVSTEPDFDKGMKQKIANTNAGIDEEIDFNYERRNMENGKQAYSDAGARIHTIDLPPLNANRSVGNPKVLIISLAPGEPVGKIMERRDATELKLAYSAVQGLYKKYLMRALDPKDPPNFYHGDLHRENMFYDLANNNTTMIDFGNAGILTPFMRQSILEILDFTKKTETDDEAALDQAINDLGEVLLNFVLKHNEKRMAQSDATPSLMRSYFRTCFNPNATIQDKNFESRDLAMAKLRMESNLKKVQKLLAEGSNLVTKETVEVIQDDIDIIKALMGNCLNGPSNPLLSALASKALISDKLNLVFQELLRNGIAMPKEVIFFNKSKALLEGILTNIALGIEDDRGEYQYVEPDDIYRSVLQQITDSMAGNRSATMPPRVKRAGSRPAVSAPVQR